MLLLLLDSRPAVPLLGRRAGARHASCVGGSHHQEEYFLNLHQLWAKVNEEVIAHQEELEKKMNANAAQKPAVSTQARPLQAEPATGRAERGGGRSLRRGGGGAAAAKQVGRRRRGGVVEEKRGGGGEEAPEEQEQQ